MGQTQSIQRPQESEPGKRYRDLAKKEGDARRELSKRSQDAWASNNGAKAKEFSIAAKTHYSAMERYNALAAAEVFEFHNPGYLPAPSPLSGALFSLFAAVAAAAAAPTPEAALAQIDLHGLRVGEALEKVGAHLALCRKHGVGKTVVITGKGLHSVDGIAKIRPQVERLLIDEGVRVMADARGNGGVFVVELGKGGEVVEGWGGWLWKGLFGSA